jgi:hypothetical protein
VTAATAVLLPAPEREQAPRRHLDIAPSRAQRRARPRIYAALAAIGGIGAILLAQLLMSIVLADGAYHIASLKKEQRDLVREQNASQERIDELSSTQSLIQNATTLGMVSSGNPVFLDVATGQALGVAGPAKGQIVGSGGNLILNTLVADGSTQLDAAAIAASQAAESGAGLGDVGAPATEASGVAPVPPTPGTIPSPTTR